MILPRFRITDLNVSTIWILLNDNYNIRSSLNSKKREMNCLERSKRDSIIPNKKDLDGDCEGISVEIQPCILVVSYCGVTLFCTGMFHQSRT